MTGMRSWIGRNTALASVVRMVKDSTSSPSGAVHVSHRPARATLAVLLSRIRCGSFVLLLGVAFHS
jgi:hypothetical protein